MRIVRLLFAARTESGEWITPPSGRGWASRCWLSGLARDPPPFARTTATRLTATWNELQLTELPPRSPAFPPIGAAAILAETANPTVSATARALGQNTRLGGQGRKLSAPSSASRN